MPATMKPKVKLCAKMNTHMSQVNKSSATALKNQSSEKESKKPQPPVSI